MVWKISGDCNGCGECCIEQPPAFMLDNGQCKYLKWDSGDERFYCVIVGTDADFRDLKESEKPGVVPQKEWDWFISECPQYPNPDNEAHLPNSNHVLPEKCGFALYEE